MLGNAHAAHNRISTASVHALSAMPCSMSVICKKCQQQQKRSSSRTMRAYGFSDRRYGIYSYCLSHLSKHFVKHLCCMQTQAAASQQQPKRSQVGSTGVPIPASRGAKKAAQGGRKPSFRAGSPEFLSSAEYRRAGGLHSVRLHKGLCIMTTFDSWHK